MPLYDGVNGVARKVVKFYDVVSRVARTVTKAYSGVNGVARQYYNSSTVNLNVRMTVVDAVASWGSERELENSTFMVTNEGSTSYTPSDFSYDDKTVITLPKGSTVQFLAIYADFYGRDCDEYADDFLQVSMDSEDGYDYVQGHEAHTTGLTLTIDQDMDVFLHIYCDGEDFTIVFGNVEICPSGYAS